MKKHTFLTIMILAIIAISSSCVKDDPSSPEGMFDGCYNHISRMRAALEGRLRTVKNLDDVGSVEDIYWIMVRSQEKFDKLVENEELYCQSLDVFVDASSVYYEITAYPTIASDCEITATSEAINPSNLIQCN